MTDDRIGALRAVEFLAPLDDATLAELLAATREVRYAAGDTIVSELETGADVFVLASGRAEVYVEPRRGERKLLRTLERGGAFGEMSSLTGGLRSATVRALETVDALVIPDDVFDHLRERRPEVALALTRTLGARLADADRTVDALLSAREAAPASDAAPGRQVDSIRRIWRTLVVERKRDVLFKTLLAFVLTLVAVRLVVYASFRFDVAPRGILRAAYVTGFALLVVSAATALLTFRPRLRTLVAYAYGIGLALIFNELGVTLAFDIFYKDIHTPDPDVPFDVERLYRRTEGVRAVAIALVVLIQSVYLRQFYRRLWFIAKVRLLRLRRRRPAT
ncbi:MAG TPA: cyclic nucleotide-binding domain-containing protein [Kofleriaceae bacterium]|nr:cyclic nucleotide-binding domain-containing protein [Kofleriaceae bacterium]